MNAVVQINTLLADRTDIEVLNRLFDGNKDLAETLLHHFGSVARVLSADVADLEVLPAVSATAIERLQTVRAAVAALMRPAVNDRPLLSSWSALLDYARVTMAHISVECLRVLYLDRKNRLLAEEQPWRGGVDHVPCYPREVLRRAIERQASAVILIHNHPSGDPTPSQADIRMTHEMAKACEVIGIVLHDHLIVSPGGHTSMRSAGLF